MTLTIGAWIGNGDVSSSNQDTDPREEALRATIAGERPPGGGWTWDIPLDPGLTTESTIPRPNAANNSRMEVLARLFSALTAAVIAGLLLLWLYLSDSTAMNRLFGGGIAEVNGRDVLIIGLIAGLGSILLNLALHPVMRYLIKSRVKPYALEASQRALLDVIPDPLFFLNFEARLEDVNRAFARAMGERPAALVGRKIYQFIGEKEQDRLYQALVKASNGEKAFVRCPIDTGRGTRIFDFHVETYQGHNTETPRLIGIARDITDQASADHLLQSRYEALHAATVKTIESISGIVELRDPYLHGHHERVAKIADALCRRLKLPDDEREGIELAARLHDIGTIKVPFEILIKPDPLTESESAIIEQHCRAGADILSRIDFPWPIAEMVLQHHENFDGSGYPNRLKGASISMGARILAVADAYDAMISHRPYRPAVGRAEALKRLTHLSGRIYDPKVVTALSDALKTANL